jgi:hypothetical protein
MNKQIEAAQKRLAAKELEKKNAEMEKLVSDDDEAEKVDSFDDDDASKEPGVPKLPKVSKPVAFVQSFSVPTEPE